MSEKTQNPEDKVSKEEQAKAEKAAKEEQAKRDKEEAEERDRLAKQAEKHAFLKKKRAEKVQGYKPRIGTGKYYHVLLEIPKFDSNTGEKVSRPVVQLMDQNTFEQFLANAPRLGYAYTILHDASPFFSEEARNKIKELVGKYIEKAAKKLIDYSKTMKYKS